NSRSSESRAASSATTQMMPEPMRASSAASGPTPNGKRTMVRTKNPATSAASPPWRSARRRSRRTTTRNERAGLNGVASAVMSIRQMQPGAQPALRRGLEGEVAAMAARHVARDGEAEPDAASGGVARGVEPEERAEDRLALLGRDAGSIVVDHDVDGAAPGQRGQPDMAAVAAGVADQIVD